jgi:hypothetical protein
MQKTRILLALAATASIAASAQAAVILSDNFDSYANQAAFEVVWPATVAGAPGLLSTDQANSAPNSVSIPSNGSTATRRSRATFAETAFDQYNDVVWSFDFYDTDIAQSPRQYANLHDSLAPGATNQLVSMGMNNNQTTAANGGNLYMARILGYTPEDTGGTSGSYFKLNDFAGATRTVGWHNLKVIIGTDDGLSTDYAFYVDNVLVETVDNIGSAASIRSYDNIVIGSGVSATSGAYYDNVSLSVVPEPTSVALIGLAGLAIKRRR